jgi:hypothetical protein
MTPTEYLREHRPEAEPAWLATFAANPGFDRAAFFASRIVYYPGSGSDGQPVQMFAQASTAHCFLYVDSGLGRDAIERELLLRPFTGYDQLEPLSIAEHELARWGYRPTLKMPSQSPHITPFCLLQVLRRKPRYGPAHGPLHVAVMFLGADGSAAFDALFCLPTAPMTAPFAVVVQDHGFGGATSRFDRGGPLEGLAIRSGVTPEFLLVANNSQEWSGYAAVPGVDVVIGGARGHERVLFTRAL